MTVADPRFERLVRTGVQPGPQLVDLDLRGSASLDLRVFAVTAVLALVAGTAVGIWPALSVTTERVFSISAGLAASTVTPGNTAPDVSLTTPAMDAWA